VTEQAETRFTFDTFVREASRVGVGIWFHREAFHAFAKEARSGVKLLVLEHWWNLWDAFVAGQDYQGDRENVYAPSVQ
jgi:ribulose 1,5-bisphosphate carboxylase large subunit-like protein